MYTSDPHSPSLLLLWHPMSQCSGEEEILLGLFVFCKGSLQQSQGAEGQVFQVGSTPAWRCWEAPSVRWCTWWCTSGSVFWWGAGPAGCRRGASSYAECVARRPGSSSAASPSRWPSFGAGPTSALWCPWAAGPARGWVGRQGGSPPGRIPPGCHHHRGSLLPPGKGMRSRTQRMASGTSCVERRQSAARKPRWRFSSPRKISRRSALNPKHLPYLSASRAICPSWRSAQEKQFPLPASKSWSRRLLRPFYDGGRKVTKWERGFGEGSSKEHHKC